MARPKRFELLAPRFVVWCSTIGLVMADLSNKIIQKRLAFRAHRSGTVLASGVPMALRDLAPPA